MLIETEVNTKISSLFYLISAIFLYCCVAVVVLIISKCIIYKKNGTRWWYALIPIFNSYILFKMLWDTKHFYISFGVSASITLISRIIPKNNLLLFSLSAFLLLIAGAVLITYDIIIYIKLARRHNKPDKFVYGMFFLPPVYFMILALSKTTTPIIAEKTKTEQTMPTTATITEKPQATQTATKPKVPLHTASTKYNPSSRNVSNVDYLKLKFFAKKSGLYDIIEKCYIQLGLISDGNFFKCDQNAVKNAVHETGIAMLLDLQKLTYEELSRIFEKGWYTVFDIDLPNGGEEFDYMAGYLLNNYANQLQKILEEYDTAGV